MQLLGRGASRPAAGPPPARHLRLLQLYHYGGAGKASGDGGCGVGGGTRGLRGKTLLINVNQTPAAVHGRPDAGQTGAAQSWRGSAVHHLQHSVSAAGAALLQVRVMAPCFDRVSFVTRAKNGSKG